MLKRLTKPIKTIIPSRRYATRNTSTNTTVPEKDYTELDKQTFGQLKEDFEDIVVQYQKIVAEKDGMAPSIKEFREMHKIPRTMKLFSERVEKITTTVMQDVMIAVICILLGTILLLGFSCWLHLFFILMFKTHNYIDKLL
jgi:hypothetical protein